MDLAVISKIKTYVGFAVKSRKIIFGIDNLIKSKQVKLVLSSSGLTETGKNKIKNFCERKNILNFEIENRFFEELIQKTGVKIVAITDKNLSDAIIKQLR